LYNFMYDLVHSVRIKQPGFGEAVLRMLDETENLHNTWKQLINVFINSLWEIHAGQKADIFLVIEDLHIIQDQKPVEAIGYLFENLPPGIHIVATTRTFPVAFPWQQWKVKGKTLVISEEDLTFNKDEIRHFFALRAGIKLKPREIDIIVERTEGWVIALEMLSEAFSVNKIENWGDEFSTNSQEFFDFLAFDVLDKQEKDVRNFLLNCSILNYINTDICRYLLGQDGPKLMQQVINKGLFIHDYGKANYRFHSLFKEFLYLTAKRLEYPLRELHCRVAQYFLEGEHYEEAINQLIKAGEYGRAAALIIRISPELIRGVRFNTLLYWLQKIPEEVYNQNPWLNVIQGDIKRLTSDFHQALINYDEAEKLYIKSSNRFEMSEVLQRKALVYLDTVQPSRAEPLLKEALALKEGTEEWKKVELLALIAENNLNRGLINEVKNTLEKARRMNIDLPVSLQARLLLRTGRLQEAVSYLENQERQGVQREGLSPKAHREVRLILSLLYSLTGQDSYTAFSFAKEGLEIGQRVGSPFTESVAAARIGHTFLVRGKLETAISWYQKAVQLSEDVRVPRGKGEPLWGLCLAYGHKGEWEKALDCGEEGKRICLEANDIWLVTLITLAQGIGCCINDDNKGALLFFLEGRSLSEQCQDPFLTTVSLMWESLLYWKAKDTKKFSVIAEQYFDNIRNYKYNFLLTNKNLWGPRDMAQLQSLLWGYHTVFAEKGTVMPQGSSFRLSPLLKGEKIDYHPGYTLYFTTLGNFTVYRGKEEVKNEEWTRDKARKLLQVLIGFRGKYVRLEQLVDMLWMNKNVEQGKQNLKVTVNTLHRILEPEREGHHPFFVDRNSAGYGLVNTDSFIVDADEFSAQVQMGLNYYRKENIILAQEVLESAVEIYRGDFLPEIEDEEWVLAEREYLRKLFMEAAEKLALIYLETQQWNKCVAMCERIISCDSCWENAYGIMITCYSRMKEKIRAVQTYKRCKENLARHLSVRPSQELVTLLKESISGL